MSGSPALGGLRDEAAVAGKLAAGGLGEESAAAKAALFARSAAALIGAGLDEERSVYATFVPGRIEVLGKHTDYAGGRSMVAAADKGFCLVAAPRGDSSFRVLDVACGQQTQFAIDRELSPAAGHWSNYPMTVARRLARNFPPPLRGADVAFGSDLPPAAGMSSSSALLISSFRVLQHVNRLSATAEYRANIHSLEDMAGYLGTCENGQTFGSLAGDKGVGTFGGSEDHTAILCCKSNSMSLYSYCPVRFERWIPLGGQYAFAIASSGVLSEKTGQAMEKYNRASRLASAVAAAWRAATGRSDAHMAAAVASGPRAPGRMRQVLGAASRGGFGPAELTARFEQFHQESEQIIPAAAQAMASGDVAEFGRLVDLSQQAAEKLLGNQVAETIHLARSARQLGAAAASAFGAGFGGSVWALVGGEWAQADVTKFLADWAAAYQRAFPAPARRAKFFLTHAGPAAFDL